MRTKGSLVGVNLLMIVVVFPTVLFLGSTITFPQMGAIIALFITWQAFAVYALRQLPSHDTSQENKTIASKTAKLPLNQKK